MLERLFQTIAALSLVLLVAAVVAPGNGALPLADAGYGMEAAMESPTVVGSICPGCPDDDEQSRQACSGGACPSALMSGGLPSDLAPRPAAYELLQERHRTVALKPELGPPRTSS